jgi:hypothetical protein
MSILQDVAGPCKLSSKDVPYFKYLHLNNVQSERYLHPQLHSWIRPYNWKRFEMNLPTQFRVQQSLPIITKFKSNLPFDCSYNCRPSVKTLKSINFRKHSKFLIRCGNEVYRYRQRLRGLPCLRLCFIHDDLSTRILCLRKAM